MIHLVIFTKFILALIFYFRLQFGLYLKIPCYYGIVHIVVLVIYIYIKKKLTNLVEIA
jgi:hypothetical protein